MALICSSKRCPQVGHCQDTDSRAFGVREIRSEESLRSWSHQARAGESESLSTVLLFCTGAADLLFREHAQPQPMSLSRSADSRPQVRHLT